MSSRSTRQANGLFLSMILLYLGTIVLLSYLASYGIVFGKIVTLLLGEALILAPAIVLICLDKEQWREWIPIHKIRISTALLLIVFSYLIMPIAMLANAVSMLFVENELVSAFKSMTEIPPVMLVLIAGIYGPICEEIAFRGAIFGRYKKSGHIMTGVVISSVMFGLMHLNGNQLGYAMILGFFFAMLSEATGSILAPMIVHAVINTHNMIMMLMSEDLLKLTGGAGGMTELSYTKAELVATIGVLIPIAAFSTVLAVGLWLLIARNEKRLDYVKSIFRKGQGEQVKQHYVTWSLVIAVLLCIFVIFILPFLPFAAVQ